jgi:hypothetical protein
MTWPDLGRLHSAYIARSQDAAGFRVCVCVWCRGERGHDRSPIITPFLVDDDDDCCAYLYYYYYYYYYLLYIYATHSLNVGRRRRPWPLGDRSWKKRCRVFAAIHEDSPTGRSVVCVPCGRGFSNAVHNRYNIISCMNKRDRTKKKKCSRRLPMSTCYIADICYARVYG